MGVKFDRIARGVRRSVREDPGRRSSRAPGKVTERRRRGGLSSSATGTNDAFIGRQPSAEGRRRRVRSSATARYQSADGTGVIFIAAKPTTPRCSQKAAADLGLTFTAVTARPAGATLQAHQAAHRPVGHVRRLDAVRPRALAARAVRVPLRASSSRRRSMPATSRRSTTCIVFPDGGIPGRRDGGGGGFGGRQPRRRRTSRRSIRDHLGRVTIAHDRPAAEAVRSKPAARSSPSAASTVLGHHLGPAGRATTSSRSRGRPASARCRGRSSTCRARSCGWRSTTRIPLAFGFEQAGRRVLRQQPRASASAPDAALTRRAGRWRGSTRRTPLRSGWAWGQHYLEGGVGSCRGAASARARCSCSGRRSPSAPSRTARSSSCSTASSMRLGLAIFVLGSLQGFVMVADVGHRLPPRRRPSRCPS